jgi:omega-6 fatty acid desaturase (delta-12 desaturase)
MNDVTDTANPVDTRGYPKDWLTEEERARFLRRSSPQGIWAVVKHYALYFTFVVLSIGPFPLPVSLLFSLICGFMIGFAFVVGHDAIHQSLTDSATLNLWIGRLAFLPSMHTASLWEYTHNRVHHLNTNLKGKDYVWVPMSPQEYQDASRLKKITYRIYRSPLGPLPYYLVEIWWKKSFLAYKRELRANCKGHLFDGFFVVLGNLLIMSLIVVVGGALSPERSAGLSLLLGWLVPFLVWNWVTGWIVFLHHQHPSIAWYQNKKDWSYYRGHILGTTESRLPLLMHLFSNNIMDHSAHHAYPRIPMYHLREAQVKIRQVYPAIQKFKITSKTYLHHVRACKLFDFERGQWTDFDGRPTGPINDLRTLPGSR